MTYSVKQTRRFARQYKKLHDNIATDVDEVVNTIAKDPAIGERKKGDLANLFVFKFRSQGQLYLLGYSRDDQVRLVFLEAVGPHENFYRDLKREQLELSQSLPGIADAGSIENSESNGQNGGTSAVARNAKKGAILL